MIYIFEDRQARLEAHKEIELNNPGYISFAKFDIQDGENIEDYVCKTFLDADCIIFHKSYTIKSHEVSINRVKDFFTGNQVKFVIFSGGNEKSSIEGSGLNATLNADVMYENLELFVRHFRNENEINLHILAWGEDYRKNQILSWLYHTITRKDLPINFIEMSPDTIISDFEETIRKIILNFNKDIGGVDMKALIEDEGRHYDLSRVTVADLRNMLESIVNKIVRS